MASSGGDSPALSALKVSLPILERCPLLLPNAATRMRIGAAKQPGGAGVPSSGGASPTLVAVKVLKVLTKAASLVLWRTVLDRSWTCPGIPHMHRTTLVMG